MNNYTSFCLTTACQIFQLLYHIIMQGFEMDEEPRRRLKQHSGNSRTFTLLSAKSKNSEDSFSFIRFFVCQPEMFGGASLTQIIRDTKYQIPNSAPD